MCYNVSQIKLENMLNNVPENVLENILKKVHFNSAEFELENVLE